MISSSELIAEEETNGAISFGQISDFEYKKYNF